MNLTLERLPDTLAVCRLKPDAPLPDWASGRFVSITRTPDELSIVCSQSVVPEEVMAERDWRYLRVAGVLDFSLVGVIARLTTVLAERDISVFVISTYDTDYFLVKEANLSAATGALQEAGYTVL